MISDFDLATYFELPLLSHSINMRHFFHLNYIRRTTYTFLVVINFRDNIYAVVKNLPTKAGDTRDVSLTLGSGRSPGVGKYNPLQYSCLENFMDRGTWRAPVMGHEESDMTEAI